MREQIWAYTKNRDRRWLLNRLSGISELEKTYDIKGAKAAQWEATLPPDFAHPALLRGNPVEIQYGGEVIWNGFLAQPAAGEESWTLRAEGAALVAGRRLAFDASGNTTSVPLFAILAAINRGLPITNAGSFPLTPISETTETAAINRLGDLLDRWAEQEGKYWAINTAWQIVDYDPPTSPSWYVTAGAAAPGRADDTYASDIFVRIQTSATNYQTITASNTVAADTHGTEEEAVDATTNGLMTVGQGQQLADSIVAMGLPELDWTEPLIVASRQITRGGIPAFLEGITRGGFIIRSRRTPNPITGELHSDIEIAEIEHTAGEDHIVLKPKQYAARDWAGSIERLTAEVYQ